MNVQDQRNRCVSINLIQKFLNLVNFRLGLLSGYSPNSIDIKPAEICPVMSILDSIDVDHGKDEEKVILFNLIEFGIGHDVVDDALKNKGALGLTWMLASH